MFQLFCKSRGNRMGHEVNVDSIHASEKRIGEHQRAVIELKRARNSLVNVSKLPPKILSSICAPPKKRSLGKRGFPRLLTNNGHTSDSGKIWAAGETPYQ